MAIPYNEPGVTIRELESPSFSVPTVGAPTLAAIVGPSRGYRDVTDVIQLTDSAAVTLSGINIDFDSPLTVVDAEDPNGSSFVESTVSVGDQDYTLTTTSGVTTIQRTMQTTIANGEEVVTYFETDSTSPAQAAGETGFVTLDLLGAEFVDGLGGTAQTSDTLEASLIVQNKGEVSTDDYILSGEGGATPDITYDSGGGVLGKFQTLYLDYTVSSVEYIDQAVQLNDSNPVSLPANADNIVVKNAPDLGSTGLDTVVAYTASDDVGDTNNDYVVTGTGITLKIHRSQGTTTIGGDDDTLRVLVTYKAVPSDYWQPTRAYSPADVEAKYGPALDSDGNVSSPLSFAAGLAFANGASELVVQALFAAGETNPTGDPSDWTSTLQNLRVAEDVNVIVPILSVGGTVVASNDNTVSSIISAVKTHIDFMATFDVRCVAICGTDSTVSGQGDQTARRALAQSIAAEDVVVLSPASYQFVNHLNRRIAVGGQYGAAAFAGMLSRYPVQTTMTRKSMVGLAAVNEVVSRIEKNRDAASGLTVLENVGGRIRVRHSLTTSTASVAKSELNVVRAKHHMLKTLVDLIDGQIIGQITADENAPFAVHVAIGGALENLVLDGVIVSYAGLRASLSTSNPTQINARFAYKPAFAVNYVSIDFNIDLGQGTVSLTETPASGA